MTPGKWRVVRRALETAMDHSASSRMQAVMRRLASHPSAVNDARRLLEDLGETRDYEYPLTQRLPRENRSFENGQMLASRFEIIGFLGAGGMGEVYEAVDHARGGRVALKTLRARMRWSEQFERRFLREVELALLVSHPNVCRIHDLFHHIVPDPKTGCELRIAFLTMELLRGETLSGYLSVHRGMSPDAGLHLVRQLVAALAAAHDRGVVHRDFKSANIFLVPDGDGFRAIVTDFGLAGVMQQAIDSHESPGSESPLASTAGGTIGYAAPEQLEGKTVTAAADVFSLAVVTCEVLTGSLPSSDSMNRLPSNVRRAVARCLEIEPSRRYQSVREFLQAIDPEYSLDGPGRTTSRRRVVRAVALASGLTAFGFLWERKVVQGRRLSSFAVLPFEMPGTGRDHASDPVFSGFTGELVRTLVASKRLHVKGQYSAGRYSPPYDYKKICRELGADALLTGVVRDARIDVRVVGSNGATLWTETFARAGRSEYELHRSIESALLAQLSRMGAQIPIPNPYVPPRDAYVAYLRGRFFWERRWAKEKDDVEAKKQFLAAVQADPRYAAAWAALATTWQYLDRMDEARSAARNALSLDPDSGDAHLSMGLVYQRADWDWALAEASYRRALDLEPSNPVAHHRYAGFLSDMGRFGESVREFEMALELDPLSVPINIAYGICLFYAREFDRSLRQLQSAARLDKSATRIYPFLGACFLFKGDSATALDYYSYARRDSPGDCVMSAHMVYALAHTGHNREAHAAIASLLAGPGPDTCPFYVAVACEAAGKREDAFSFLNRAFAQHDPDMTLVKVHPYLDGMRSERPYRGVLSLMKLA